MRNIYWLLAALGVAFLSASASHAISVSPAHPGLETGAPAPQVGSSGGPAPRGTAIQNINTGLFYPTIQAAHDAAATVAGHTLEVQVSSHTEGTQISITKGITLRGQTGSEVVLQSGDTGNSGDARGWFLINAGATGFSAEDLTFDGNGYKVWQGFRIWAANCSFDNCTLTDMQYDASGPSYAGTAIVTIDAPNLSVTNCTLSQIGRNGLFYYGPSATGGVADNNTYTGKGAGDWLDYGIELGNGAVANCTDNTITECRGVASSDGSTSAAILITTFFGGGTTGNVSGNFLNSNTGAIAGGYDGADTSDITASDNDLSGNDTYTVDNPSTTTVHDCSANWHGSNVAATVAAGISGTAGGVDYTPWLDVGTDTDGGTVGFQGDFSTLNVDDDSPQTGATGRIKEGIDLVTASTVNVMAGTYSGNIQLGKSVTLNGANAGTSGCGRVAGGIPSPATESVLTAASGIILELRNGCAGSTIDGFAFDGALAASNGIRSSGGPLNNLTIQNNWIGRTTSSGIFLNDSGADITVQKNELDGSAHGGGGYMHLDQDSFDGFHFIDNCVLNAASGTGLFVDGNHNVGMSGRAPLISGNVFDGNGTGANLGRFAFEDGTISNNTFDSNTFDGLQGGIQSTTISGNLFDSNGRSGLTLTGFGGGGDPTRGAQNCTITGNTFTGNVSEGIFFSSSQFPGTISTNVANDNDIAGNAVGVTYGGTEVIDVSCNWWGDIGGPDAPASPNPAGDDISGTTFVFWPWLDGSIAGSPNCDQYGGNNVAAEPDGDCLSIDNTCETVSVNFNRTDTSGARGISVTIQLSSELELCVSPGASINRGTWLDAYDPTPGVTFLVVDNGGGSYTVDQSILGLPCGETSGGQLFTVDVKAAGGDGTGTITVTEVIVRDCANAPLPGIPGAPAYITIDTVPPTAVADLTAAQLKAGNAAGQDTTGIIVSFTAPGSATVLEIYGAGYGNYPEYDDAPGAGSVPAIPSYPPGAPWTLASTSASPDTVHFATRDFWYFVMFTKDACGNVSAVSNMTGGTLNYHLGDVSDGTTPGHGDNSVATADMSLLGSNYGITLGPSDPKGYLDVGPTSDFSVDALPDTDNEIEFEDLMMFAINFGQVSARGVPESPEQEAWETPSIALEVEDANLSSRLTARLMLHDNVEAVKGVHSVVSYDRERLELIEVRRGELLDRQGLVFFADLDTEEGVLVDAAVMGRDRIVSGSGEVAELQFRVLAPGARPALAEADLRDRANRPAGRPSDSGRDLGRQDPASPEITGVPARIELVGARPNPFDASTEIVFRLPQATAVSLKIYDVSGRLVRTLVDRVVPPGEMRAAWDGRSNDGQLANAGVYFYTFQAAEQRETRKIVRFR